MCLIGFAWQASAEYPFALVANRDEFHARPTAPMHWWHEPRIAAGRDLQAGGTWLGVNKQGRFAAITNFRDGTDQTSWPGSRGSLVSAVLAHVGTLDEVQAHVDHSKNEFAGFNLLFGDLFGEQRELRFTSNRGQDSMIVTPGIYSFSNGAFGAKWPKIERTNERLTRALRHRVPDGFWDVLSDRESASAADLPDTGVGAELESFLSPVFIVGQTYGTRSSHRILCRQHLEIDVAEMRYNPSGELVGASNIRIKPP
ncbi:MAG: NRDE family protein [Gammaproteobacteria bacterium]|nr:NRDE family protein [Gammaproteobacteria bacterium]